MDSFHELLQIIERLLGPGGCSWDQEQTQKSMRPLLIEEVYEVVDAIDRKDNPHLLEELGDLFFNVVFTCRLSQKEGVFSLQDVIRELNTKLIRRHPHVFGDAKISSTSELLKQWDKIKETEKRNSSSSAEKDAIPKPLPALIRAQKVLKKVKKSSYPLTFKEQNTPKFTEKTLGDALINLISQAQDADIDAEQALRLSLMELENNFSAHNNLQKDEIKKEEELPK